MQSTSVFLDIAKFVDFLWKMLISVELKGCVTWFISFLDLLWQRYICAKFHHCRICVTDIFLVPPPIREQPRKSPPWIGLMENFSVCAVNQIRKVPLHKKLSFLLRISPVNVTKCAVSYTYWKSPSWKTSFLCSVRLN